MYVMKLFIRIMISMMLISLSVFAVQLEFKKGWQLVGSAKKIDDMRVFDENAELLWAYDTVSRSWKAYATTQDLRDKLRAHDVEELNFLMPHEAFWIKSRRDWQLSQESVGLPSKEQFLELKRGWNLVSFSDSLVLEAEIFRDKKIWKYDGNWSTFDDTKLYPSASTISSQEGFWLYSDKDEQIDIAKESSKLRNFDDRDSMLEHIRKMMSNYSFGGNNDISNDDTSAKIVEDATTTNTQESGVDEPDILKHDGEKIFFYDSLSQLVRVYTFADILEGKSEEVSSIGLDGFFVSMFLRDDKLYLTQQVSGKMLLKSYDVSDVESIELLASMELDGGYVDSRLSSDGIYLISTFIPTATYTYPVVYPSDTNCSNIYVAMQECKANDDCEYATPPSETTPPDYVLSHLYDDARCHRYSYDENGTAYYTDYTSPSVYKEYLEPLINNKPLLEPQKLYAPYKLNQEYSITTILKIGFDGKMKDSVSYLGSSHTIYVSKESIYLLSSQYSSFFDFGFHKDRVSIYKFSMAESLEYRGRGFVDGRTLNQYSLSEHNNILRIATTVGWGWQGGETDNIVYALEETDGSLEIVGKLDGLGEEGETIHSVRFVGDRGFVVTFRQTDPFYTIDLSDPTDIRKVGELKIDGFSSYLHPVDENRILSIGRDANASGAVGGFLIQLFDISDFASPKLADRVVLGDRYTYSTAEWNPRAFIYRDSDAMFGFPLSAYSYHRGRSSSGFSIYGVVDLELKRYTSFEQVTQKQWYRAQSRGVIFDVNSTTYAVMFQADKVMLTKIKGE